ncbi:hypothetical protein F2Q68_00020645 [Brassica cretica]|uniref:Uncharacterized protein n=1 Tax=Brassica cretica TaxID=69181 RepID=A0A8S9FPA3_BRACR|nr:hypothetical protein F2Q68_00020645 [Brassica cretica]
MIAIIDDDFWQVVKEEKIQEGNFQVESSTSRKYLMSIDIRLSPSVDVRLLASIDTTSQLPIDIKTQPTIDMTTPTSIDDHLIHTECSYQR